MTTKLGPSIGELKSRPPKDGRLGLVLTQRLDFPYLLFLALLLDHSNTSQASIPLRYSLKSLLAGRS